MRTAIAALLGIALLGACQSAASKLDAEPAALPEIRYFMIADT